VKSLKRQYAGSFTDRSRGVNHLFLGRFKGVLVEGEGHLLELLRYIFGSLMLSRPARGVLTWTPVEWARPLLLGSLSQNGQPPRRLTLAGERPYREPKAWA